MQQLSGLDASFLALETANTTGHVGGLSVLDPRDAPEPLTLARLTEVMAERLPLVPVLRRKLLNVPFGLDQPYWVDDADFDIEYHVREIALPRPGSDAQLDEQVSRLHARPLDRSRPLWELYLITGLAKNRAAESGKEIDVLIAIRVPEQRSFAAVHDDWDARVVADQDVVRALQDILRVLSHFAPTKE